MSPLYSLNHFYQINDLLSCIVTLLISSSYRPWAQEELSCYGVSLCSTILYSVMFLQGRAVSRELAEVHDGSAQHDSEHRCANLVLAQQQSCPIDFYLVTTSQSHLHLSSITIFLFLYITHFNLDLRCVVECKLL